MAPAKQAQRTEYLNRTQGWLSARRINRKGDEENLPIRPGERVFLTAEEVELTAQSHRLSKDSPFEPREITWFALSTGERLVTFTAPALQATADAPAELPEEKAMREFRERNAKDLQALGI